LTSCRVFNFQKRHKCQNFLLSLNRDQGLRGCDVFGFVNPHTFCELKNRHFWQLRLPQHAEKAQASKVLTVDVLIVLN
jgi:hypothetical protein